VRSVGAIPGQRSLGRLTWQWIIAATQKDKSAQRCTVPVDPVPFDVIRDGVDEFLVGVQVASLIGTVIAVFLAVIAVFLASCQP
jgi:hypothetical protein